MKVWRKYADLIHKNFLLLLVILVSLVISSNLGKFPYFEGDEGIYISRAWAFINERSLSAGTYWYDHPPLGWFFIGFWLFITRSEVLFDSLLVSGRILMIILQTANIVMIYMLTKKMTNSKYAAAFASTLFIISPLQIYFGRRILLDNIMTFWIMLSLTTLLFMKDRLLRIGLSSLFFAFAVLTKENAILFIIPIALFFHINDSSKENKKNMWMWLGVSSLFIILYPLFALLRGELLPTGYFETGGKPSLISTLTFQAQRGKSGVFDFDNNAFWEMAAFWLKEDPVVFGLGLVSVLINLGIFFYKKDKLSLTLALFIGVQMLFLMRGGVVYEFYLLPLIPFFCINLTRATAYFLFLSKKVNWKDLIFTSIIIFLTFITALKIKGFNTFTTNQTKAQFEAVNYILENLDGSIVVIADSYAKGDLYKVKNIEIKSQFDAEYDWEFKQEIESSEKKVDYIIYTKQVGWDIDGLEFVNQLVNNTKAHKEFDADFWDVKILQPK